MKNQAFSGTPTSRRFALCPSSILAGQAVLLGAEPAVAVDSYQANEGGTTFATGGSFVLSVIGRSVLSPLTNAAIKPGSPVYAVGTLDTTTNVTSITALDAVATGTLFGYIDPSYTSGVTSGVTDAAAIVRLKGAE